MISRQAVRLFSRQAQLARVVGVTAGSNHAAPVALTTLNHRHEFGLLDGVSGQRNAPRASHRWFSSTSEDEKKPEEEEIISETKEDGDEETSSEEEEGLTEKEQALQAEVQNLKDQLLRSLAEQENTRNIAKRDVSDARQFAIKSFAKALLDVSDNLSRAMDSVSPEDLTESTQLKSLYEGIEMTNTGLLKAFASNGITKFCEKPGDKFDPSMHNALMQYPDPNAEPETVGQVIKVGFMLNDRILRPAEVGVVKKA